MTHRGRQIKKDRMLRYLDLSFEGRQHQNNGIVHNNGLRPQGQGRFKGIQRQAACRPRTAHKPVDYQSQLETDIQRLLEAERTDNAATSGWNSDVTRQPAPSPEPSLQQPHCRLASGKLERQNNEYNKVSARKTAHQTREAETTYRPGTGHKYLKATEKRPRTAGYEGEHRLGRPTRTTLLRARQRCNSAPITSYESRYDQKKQAEQHAEVKKQYNTQTNQSLSDLLTTSIPTGESLHSYLIGARYNRAHHVDQKSLKDHGVYVSRHTVGVSKNCFVIKKAALRQRESQEEPQKRDYGSEMTAEHTVMAVGVGRRTITPSPQPSPSQRPAPSPTSSYIKRSTFCRPATAERAPGLVCQPAWSERKHLEVNGGPTPVAGDQPSPTSVDGTATNDVMNVKSVGFIGSPPKIARPMTEQMRHASKRHSPNGSVLSVMVQGRSIYNFNIIPGSAPGQAPVSSPNHIPENTAQTPTIRPKSSVGPRRPLTVRDVRNRMQEDDMQRQDESAPRSTPRDTESEGQAPFTAISRAISSSDNVEVMSTGSEEEDGGRLCGPSPSPATSPRNPSAMSPNSSPVRSPPTSPVRSPPTSPVRSPPTSPARSPPTSPPRSTNTSPPRSLRPSPTTSPQQDTACKSEPQAEEHNEVVSLQETSVEVEMEKLTPIISNPKRAPSARARKAHVRFADELTPEASSDSKDDKADGASATLQTENGMSGNLDLMVEPVVPVDDEGDFSLDSQPNEVPLVESTAEPVYDGSGDGHREELSGEVIPLVNTTVSTGDADSGSLACDEQLQPVKVISVDIVQKVSSEKI